MLRKILVLSICLFFAEFSMSYAVNFVNPLAFNTVDGFLTSILAYLQGVMGVIAVIAIVIGGIMYMTSAGDPGKVEKAKSTVTYAMIGLAIAIAAPSFISEIASILGWGGGGVAPTLTEIALSVLNFLLSMVGILAIIMLVVGGITYTTSAGDEDKIESGKKIVKFSIIGIIVALLALVMVSQIANILN